MTEDNKEITIPDDLTSLHKEIDLIQNCISRMAQNSFMIKGWAVTIVVITWAIIGIAELDFLYILLLLIPIICFWGLDAYFVQTERRYRKLYEWILKQRLELENNQKLYQLDSSICKNKVGCWLRIVFTKTLVPFYGSLVAVVIITTIAIAIKSMS